MSSSREATTARLQELLSPLLIEAGSELEDLTVTQAGRRSVVRVLVDRDGGIDMDGVAAASRLVSEALDALDESDPALFGTAYVLEVSSPGVDRPLTEPRHWRRNTTRLVTVTLVAGGTVTGRVTSADDSAVTLDVDGTDQVLPYAEIVRGNVQVEFNRKDVKGAEDSDAADDIEGDEPAPGDDA